MHKINRVKHFLALLTIIILTATVFTGCKKNIDDIIASPPEEYVNYTVNGSPYTFEKPVDSLLYVHNNLTLTQWIYGNQIPASANYVNVAFDIIPMSVGTYQHLLAFKVNQIPANAAINAPIFVRITEYGSTGQFITGDFSGSYTGPAPTNTIYNITCKFRIRRNF